jgi:hypothetical protein
MRMLGDGSNRAVYSPEYIDTLKANSIINDCRKISAKEIPEIGLLTTYGFTTEIGHSYSAQICTPDSTRSPHVIIGTTAWLTSVRGHNEHTNRAFANAGLTSLTVGPEGSYRASSCQNLRAPISLMDSAAAVLAFSNLVLKEHDVQTKNQLLFGESRGAMVGMGILSLAKDFGQSIGLADLIAPCFPRQMKPSDVLKLCGQVIREPIETMKFLGNISLGRIVHYPATFDPNPSAVVHNAAMIPALISGEAGELAKQVDTEALMHITCFRQDAISMIDEWRAIFNDHPNVRITPLPGSHLTIVSPQTLGYVIARALAYTECVDKGQTPNPQNVFDASHELVKS